MRVSKLSFIFLFIPMISLLSSCVEQDAKEEKIRIFDPKIPGGKVKTSQIQEVSSLEAIPEFDKVTLSWRNPPVYAGLSYKIHIFRILGDGSNFELPNPGQSGSSAFLYYPRSDFEPLTNKTLYVDQNGELTNSLYEDNDYTYFVVVEKEGVFSSGKKITIHIPRKGSDIEVPPPTEFWQNYTNRVGGRPDPDTLMITMNTLDPGIPTTTLASGGFSYSHNGMVKYQVDTKTNRVMIYVNSLGKACYDDHPQGSIDFDICIAINQNAPLMPYGVLGQKDFSTNYSCQNSPGDTPMSECFTNPTQALVTTNNKLLISDSGNNRVLIWDTLPTYGCYNFQNMLGDTTPIQCAPSRVIGQKNITDTIVNYDVETEGESSLSCPNGLAQINNNIYIADTCNHRIVQVRNALDPALFECSPATWLAQKCIFGGVLGQENLNSRIHFKEEYLDNGSFSYDFVNNKLVGDPYFLKRHFSNPKHIKILDNKMFISADEDFTVNSPYGRLELFGRILRFDTPPLEGTFPPCTPLTFPTGGCDYSYSYGQENHETLVTVPLSGNYMDSFYTLKKVGGITFLNNMMFATDTDNNIVSIWEDYANNTIPGGPASQRVINPKGTWNAEKNRQNPDLKGLGNIEFRREKNSLDIIDAGSHYYYFIQVIKPF